MEVSHFPAPNLPCQRFQIVDRKISEAMMSIWTQFARTGNPSVKGLIEWPAWDEAGDRYLFIAETLEIKSGYSDLTKIQPIRIGISL